MKRRGRVREGLFLICLALLISIQARARGDEYIRSYLTVKDGLSQNEVTSIVEDRNGFMWFGTRGGLNRYDGYNFKIFKPGPQAENSIRNPSVEMLFFDSSGKAWIGTKSGGISIYDPVQEIFEANDSVRKNLPDRVVDIMEDLDGNFWIGGFYDGLSSYQPKTGELRRWIINNRVQSIVQTPDSTIWAGTNNALLYKKPGEDDFKSFSPGIRFFTVTEILIDPDEPWLWFTGWGLPLVRLNYEDFSYETYETGGNMDRIYSLLMDKEGLIWAGTWGSGLYRFDAGKEFFEKVDIYPDERFSKVLDFDIILDIYQDSKGLIWVGTDGGGIVMLSPSAGFSSVNSFNNGEKYHVTALMESSDRSLFIGTRDQGLLVSKDTKQFTRVGIQGETAEAAKQNVYCIERFGEGLAWVGLENGLFILQRRSKDSWVLVPASSFYANSLLNTRTMKVLDVLKRGDELWIATQQRGLFFFKDNGNHYSLVRNYSQRESAGGLMANRVTALHLDAEQGLIAATYNGLYRYSANDSLFISINSLLEEGNKPLCNIVLCSYMDSGGNLWFGTPCSMNKLSPDDSGKYLLEEYFKEDGLPDDYVSNILEDHLGNIWFSSNAGISKLDLGSSNIYNFASSDGTGTFNFSESAVFRSSEGRIYFGGFSGYTYFDPGEIVYNTTTPPVAITSFKVLNREVEVDPDGILPVSANNVDRIVLGHRDKEISIEFAALDYKSPASNQYQYKLEKKGSEEQWEYLGNRRMISYQNLKPGEYTLYLKGSNSNGIWNKDSKKIQIKILASPLRQWYAVMVYILFILGVITSIIWVSLKQERLKSEAHMEHVKLEQEKQMNEYKLRFFTNISHEFRTPLSMILAPLNDLVRNENNELNRGSLKKVGMVKKNAERLLKLINQLIEFRKVEVGRVKLEVGEKDVVQYMKEISEPFSELAKQKGIEFEAEYNIRKAMLYFDPAKLSIVMNNLIGNALKYCGEPGYVHMQMFEDGSEICIVFTNDGKGIKPVDLENIFDRFYQVSSSRYMDSSGIGLALVKNYVEMHQGSISVESTPNKSTSFEVRLKKGRDHFSDDDIRENPDQEVYTEVFLSEEEITSEPVVFHHMGTRGSKIVVIDDNRDVREYLSDLLSPYYEVSLAENGVLGFEKILETVPDLILSDVMMPEMDGYELCERIKSHEQLSHIPFAMLTAKDTDSDRIFGAKKGADYYITKPFDSVLILEKVRQVLTSRKQLVQKLSRKVVLDPVDKEITSEDERILKSAIKIIEKNIENYDLNLDMMAKEMAMSSSTLYRKMMAISGLSPGEFIRSVRFKRAAQLLRDSDLAVSEIIEHVGYHSVKQFRENFKTEYGTSPINYRKQHREGGTL